MVDVELDDRKYTAAHYGHICRAQVRYDAKTKKGSVQIIDERDGGMKNEIRAMLQDPARKAEGQKLHRRSFRYFPRRRQAGRMAEPRRRNRRRPDPRRPRRQARRLPQVFGHRPRHQVPLRIRRRRPGRRPQRPVRRSQDLQRLGQVKGRDSTTCCPNLPKPPSPGALLVGMTGPGHPPRIHRARGPHAPTR